MRLDETNEVRETRSALISQDELAALGLPPRCYAAHPHEPGAVVLLLRGEMGYHATRADGFTADQLNEGLKVTKAQAQAMLSGSLFGFHCPAANPKFQTALSTKGGAS